MAAKDKLTLPDPDWVKIRTACGCIVGSVEIVGCVESHPSAFFVGKYGFVLRNPVPLECPVPFKGALGLFNVPVAVIGDAA
jgi:hypothetical protein